MSGLRDPEGRRSLGGLVGVVAGNWELAAAVGGEGAWGSVRERRGGESWGWVQVGLAQMLKGGVIMDVTTPEEARIAEEAGAVAVMALERVPADIRRDGGVARMSDADVIRAIKETVTIPVMAKARIGHFVEAQILEALKVDYVDESEVGAAACLWSCQCCLLPLCVLVLLY